MLEILNGVNVSQFNIETFRNIYLIRNFEKIVNSSFESGYNCSWQCNHKFSWSLIVQENVFLMWWHFRNGLKLKQIIKNRWIRISSLDCVCFLLLLFICCIYLRSRAIVYFYCIKEGCHVSGIWLKIRLKYACFLFLLLD